MIIDNYQDKNLEKLKKELEYSLGNKVTNQETRGRVKQQPK